MSGSNLRVDLGFQDFSGFRVLGPATSQTQQPDPADPATQPRRSGDQTPQTRQPNPADPVTQPRRPGDLTLL
eukprot:5552733-Pyramimonas_sp.AAC.1